MADETAELQERVRRVLDTNHYLILGTSEDDGRPRVTPVYFKHDDYRTFYWISSPDAQHSHNVGARDAVSFAVFDSTATPPNTAAVYVVATAEQVPDDELDVACASAFREMRAPFRAYAPEELRAPADLRFYRARAISHGLHIPGSEPGLGKGIDYRLDVPMP